jgi:hypothetical protein
MQRQQAQQAEAMQQQQAEHAQALRRHHHQSELTHRRLVEQAVALRRQQAAQAEELEWCQQQAQDLRELLHKRNEERLAQLHRCRCAQQEWESKYTKLAVSYLVVVGLLLAFAIHALKPWAVYVWEKMANFQSVELSTQT